MLDRIINTLAHFSTIDILLSLLDITVLWYLIYQTLKIIKGTKAVQVLLGLLLITVLYFISKPEVLDLTTLNWSLEKFIASFVIIVVIIFQEDIRKGLGEFGKSNPLASATDSTFMTSPIEELIKATAQLSEKRIGALIAIEMEASLDEYLVEGIRINADITKELLVSLFIPYKANPTHDGAVIIRNNRIYSAGCFLPLSTNDKIDKSLGTRHRAAIGLSEATDAVILVVSEETGIISVAYKEELTRRLTPEELRDLLYKLFNTTLLLDAQDNSGSILKRFRLQRNVNRPSKK